MCQNHCEVPENEDEPYVCAYYVTDEEFADDVDALYEINFTIRIFFTTKRLLKFALTAVNMHADATYKLIWQGFPVLMVGTTDKQNHYISFGIAVTTSETKQDFEFIFKSLISGLKSIDGSYELKPKIIMADAADSISNGFKQAFKFKDDGLYKRSMCAIHVRRAIEKYGNFNDTKNKAKVIKDFIDLQIAQNQNIFNEAAELFINKWCEKEDKFTAYFRKEWLDAHNNKIKTRKSCIKMSLLSTRKH